MQLSSGNFGSNASMPTKFTCDGNDINPSLLISGVPEQAKSLVLIMDDPDAVKPAGRIWNHWIIFNIPPDTSEINEGENPPGIQGRNTGNKIGYQGPCPPDKEHRYFFKVYALDSENINDVNKDNFLQKIQGHTIDSIEIIGLYQKNK